MKQWTSVNELLDFAIEKEQQASDFYTGLAGKMENPAMRDVFEQFAHDEQGHKAKLIEVKRTGALAPASGKVLDLKVGDYLVDVDQKGELSYQDALILAMKREKASFKLYRNMAGATNDADLRSLLLALAQEEAKHKLYFETEYDEQFLKEN
jgi:rubrerythrin